MIITSQDLKNVEVAVRNRLTSLNLITNIKAGYDYIDSEQDYVRQLTVVENNETIFRYSSLILTGYDDIDNESDLENPSIRLNFDIYLFSQVTPKSSKSSYDYIFKALLGLRTEFLNYSNRVITVPNLFVETAPIEISKELELNTDASVDAMGYNLNVYLPISIYKNI